MTAAWERHDTPMCAECGAAWTPHTPECRLYGDVPPATYWPPGATSPPPRPVYRKVLDPYGGLAGVIPADEFDGDETTQPMARGAEFEGVF